jgi:putative transcriptional regulator
VVIGTSLKGRLLVATPALGEGIFDRSVVLIIEHDDTEGAFGVVLNRPSTTDVEGALPEWAGLAASPPVVFVGGPVSPEAAICLGGVLRGGEKGWVPLVGAPLYSPIPPSPGRVRPPPTPRVGYPWSAPSAPST